MLILAVGWLTMTGMKRGEGEWGEERAAAVGGAFVARLQQGQRLDTLARPEGSWEPRAWPSPYIIDWAIDSVV